MPEVAAESLIYRKINFLNEIGFSKRAIDDLLIRRTAAINLISQLEDSESLYKDWLNSWNDDEYINGIFNLILIFIIKFK